MPVIIKGKAYFPMGKTWSCLQSHKAVTEHVL